MLFSTPKAENDLEVISNRHLQQSVDLDKSFINEIERAVKKIFRNPTAFRYINRNVRRVTLKKFPYYIYFTYKRGITILRSRHTKQQTLKRFT